jgi:signal transduction histidine kinase
VTAADDSAATNPLDPDWRREPVDRKGIRRDGLVAVALLVGTLLSTWLYARAGVFRHPAPVWQCVLWSAAMTLPLTLRRVYPIAVCCILTAAFIVGQLISVPELLFCNITLFVAFFSIGAWSPRRTPALLTRATIIAVMFVWLFTSLILGGSNSAVFSTAGAFSPYLAYGLISIITNLLYFGAAYYFGQNAWRAARERAALDARTAELTAERERSAAQAVALERVRIARELHDVVAHHVSVMGVQAGAARLVLGSDPAKARDALSAVEDSSRTAVEELQLMLRTLRSDDSADVPADATSTRGIAQLAELAADAVAAGLPVRHVVVGAPRVIPPTIEFSAYRIAQEALTNTRKHAGAVASAELRVRYLDDAVEVEVSDTGTGGRSAVAASGGLGQLGMRERVAAVGGTIEYGPKPRGGYLVRARFPTGTAAGADPGTAAGTNPGMTPGTEPV